MTHDDSIQIAAKSLAQRPALARMSRGGKASGLETLGNVKPASASRPRGKFSALQSVENAQNAERISILREPVPLGRRNVLAPTRKARRAADAGEQGAGAIARAPPRSRDRIDRAGSCRKRVRGAKVRARDDRSHNFFAGGFPNRQFSESMGECRGRRTSMRLRLPS